MNLLNIYKKMKPELAYVEQQMEATIDTDQHVLFQASTHLLKAGGKRIRPVFVLLSGQFGTYDREKVMKVAASLELIHMATLVHDDVIDDAATRRGNLTVKSKWDNRIAMYTGDYLFAKALTVVTDIDNEELHCILSKAMVDMSIGEMEQIRLFYDTDQSVYDYLLRIRRKTAILIAISCQLGAIAAGATRDVARRLYRFGYNVGMAFQIIDDILDINGTEKQIGKPPGSDMRQGNITLPVIYALQHEDIREQLLHEIALFKEHDGQVDASTFISLIRASDGINQSQALADKYIAKAMDAIESLPDLTAKKDLINIANFIVKRKY
ncbi:polyprenyl synthetase family protein [Longirhabdus pacifica]|uniref:polyprenyl synthetase family protein n=1 Tax=Longirhabdus pacifica TaxID=2305227 RepID=UPI0010087B84|nr:polyprenyl synthetase family protein [Longirhabdus pacifica]